MTEQKRDTTKLEKTINDLIVELELWDALTWYYNELNLALINVPLETDYDNCNRIMDEIDKFPSEVGYFISECKNILFVVPEVEHRFKSEYDACVELRENLQKCYDWRIYWIVTRPNFPY